MVANVTPTQHPDGGLLDSYVTIAGGSTGDLFDELTNLPDLEARLADFEAGLLRFTHAKLATLAAVIECMRAVVGALCESFGATTPLARSIVSSAKAEYLHCIKLLTLPEILLARLGTLFLMRPVKKLSPRDTKAADRSRISSD